MINREFLEKYSKTLVDLSKLISENKFFINNLSNEPKVDFIQFKWDIKLPQNSIDKKIVKPLHLKSTERNIVCKLCLDRSFGIRNFLHKGNVPILVLHYTGEFRPNLPIYTKPTSERIFRNFESEEIFHRMIQKVFSISMRDFYYQEYPGCVFSNKTFDMNLWKNRLENCNAHIQETIESEKIKAILITGGAAVLLFGKEDAQKKIGLIEDFSFGSTSIPTMVIRSPDAVLQIENRRKNIDQKKNPNEFKKAKEQENQLKIEIVNYLQKFKDRFF
jgi:hypothetical protein